MTLPKCARTGKGRFADTIKSYLLAKKVNEISLLEKHVENLVSPGSHRSQLPDQGIWVFFNSKSLHSSTIAIESIQSAYYDPAYFNYDIQGELHQVIVNKKKSADGHQLKALKCHGVESLKGLRLRFFNSSH